MSENTAPRPEPALAFRGGWPSAFIPIGIFLTFCVLYLLVFKAFDMTALAMGALVGLLAGAILCRNYAEYWEAVKRGIGSPVSTTIVMILFIISMFAGLMKASNVGAGFVWLGQTIGIGSGGFVAFVFAAVVVICMATGSSIGTMFAAFPFFFPAGVLLGAPPALLAGAIVSGAIFGDNLGPVTDTTTISASTQNFRGKRGVADIAGVVKSRAPYAAVAGTVSLVLFFIFGELTASNTTAPVALDGAASNPRALIMLIPAAAMLVVAFTTRNIFKAITVGLVTGILFGLAFGLIQPSDIIGVADGMATGFLVAGVTNMIGTITLVITVFGIMGVLTSAGVLDLVVERLAKSKMTNSARGVETAIALGISAIAVLFAGVNSAAMVTFGPVVDRMGAEAKLHPYRRANVMDCFAMGIGCVIPFLSCYLFIASSLTSGYEGVAALNTTEIFTGTFYPLVLTVVMIVAVLTGWGRRFEAADSRPVKTVEETQADPDSAVVAG
ncbi:MAG: hypothetical protein LBS56_05215 [Propionibacteriaceae bacterium]|jgi:Na+/H+ antiporter NhaC|nr:hypothetical protein [Propionibacteriaceae bacterium]